MKKAVISILALALVAPMAGCMVVAGQPTVGAFYSDVHGPIDAEGAVGSKTGEACANSWFGVVSIGDASIASAAKNGGIKSVTGVDHHTTNIIGISKFCTIVHGN